MTEGKHTPGQWEYLDIGVIVAGDDLSITVAIINDCDNSPPVTESEANGILIAAAPDMLEALKSAAASIEQLVRINRIPANNKGLREALAAIAKAEGRS